MASILSEVEERTHEPRLADGPSNPMAQHAYDGFAKGQRQSSSGSGLVLGATAVGLVLVLASVFGFWILKSVRRLNRQVAHLNRQTEQLNRRVQSAEQQAQALTRQASQAASAQVPALQPDQPKEPETTSAAQAQAPAPSERAAQPVNPGISRTEESPKQPGAKLQKLQQSLEQIAETQRSAHGLVTTLGDKTLRFASDKSDIAPQYRSILNRIASVLKTAKGYSIYVYGYTDENGSRDYNLKLSARRARAVRDALVKAGIDPSSISTKGFGKSKPLVRGSSARAQAGNRRVEIGIVDSTLVSADQPTSRTEATIR